MWKFIKKLIFTLIILSILGIVAGRFINPPITLTQIGGIVEYGKLKRDYISYDEMGNHVKKAVIAAEDQKFFVHNGFDYDAIQKAYEKNNQGKKLRGGSTISQQTAKNILPGLPARVEMWRCGARQSHGKAQKKDRQGSIAKQSAKKKHQKAIA